MEIPIHYEWFCINKKVEDWFLKHINWLFPTIVYRKSEWMKFILQQFIKKYHSISAWFVSRIILGLWLQLYKHLYIYGNAEKLNLYKIVTSTGKKTNISNQQRDKNNTTTQKQLVDLISRGQKLCYFRNTATDKPFLLKGNEVNVFLTKKQRWLRRNMLVIKIM